MKIRLLTYTVILLLTLPGAISRGQDLTGTDEGLIYVFGKHYIDLATLQEITNVKDTTAVFNKTGKYAGRLSFPSWFEGYPRQAIYKSSLSEIVDDKTIRISGKDEGKLITKMISVDDGSTENVNGNNFLAATTHGVIHVKRLNGNTGCIIRKYDENGQVIFKTDFEHTHINTTVYEQTYCPYLYYFAHTDLTMVFTSPDKQFSKTVLVDLKTGALTHLEFIVNGIIRTEDEKEVIGLVVMDTEWQTLGVKTNNSKWVVKTGNNYHNRAETLLTGNTLIIATFSPIATGVSLSAYDYLTGSKIWDADVKQLNAAHSKYYNTVTLSAYNEKIILEGKEAAGSYLQIFDLGSGERLFTDDDFVK